MKHNIATVVALLSLACAPLSQAQNRILAGSPNAFGNPPTSTGKRASPGATIFYLLMAGTSEQRPTFWTDTLRDSSLTPAEIEKLLAYAKKAKAENLEFQYKEQEKLCAGKDKLTTLDTVAAALTRFSASNASNIEQLGNEATKSLGDRLGMLLVAASGRATFMVSETDHKNLMIAMNKEPIAHIQSFCTKKSPPTAP